MLGKCIFWIKRAKIGLDGQPSRNPDEELTSWGSERVNDRELQLGFWGHACFQICFLQEQSSSFISAPCVDQCGNSVVSNRCEPRRGCLSSFWLVIASMGAFCGTRVSLSYIVGMEATATMNWRHADNRARCGATARCIDHVVRRWCSAASSRRLYNSTYFRHRQEVFP
jgi:hypothetical protein